MTKFDCTPLFKEFLKELPKCEHHLHLEGTLEPELLFALAKRNNITLPQEFPSTIEELRERYTSFTNLQDFLNLYYVGTDVLIEENDYYDLAWAYFKKAHEQGLVHAEVFYDPQSHTSRGVSIETVTAGFKRACDRATAELNISTRLIMCLLKHTPLKECLETVEQAHDLISNGTISGLGMDSTELGFMPNIFAECYKRVKEINPDINLTSHAGEEGGPEYVVDALDNLGVQRIDHGVRAAEDDELLKRLAKEKIMLTVCPLSNVRLCVVKDVFELPLQKFIDYGVPFSINSDDPAYFGGYILENYITVQTRFGWDLNTWCQIAHNSIDGSWCLASRKSELHERVEAIKVKYAY